MRKNVVFKVSDLTAQMWNFIPAVKPFPGPALPFFLHFKLLSLRGSNEPLEYGYVRNIETRGRLESQLAENTSKPKRIRLYQTDLIYCNGNHWKTLKSGVVISPHIQYVNAMNAKCKY